MFNILHVANQQCCNLKNSFFRFSMKPGHRLMCTIEVQTTVSGALEKPKHRLMCTIEAQTLVLGAL